MRPVEGLWRSAAMAKRILLVDDDADTASNIARVLRSHGYEVVEARSGAEGLKKALATRPDLILLDIMMENDTAGLEVSFQIRSDRPTSRYRAIRDVPIIMLSAIDQATNARFSLDEKASFLPGVNDFLTKPVNMDSLLVKVAKHAP
jgi:CheY-like chemotaxis protein